MFALLSCRGCPKPKTKDFALSHRMARPSMDYVDEGNLIFFPEATHWVQHDAADEVNHYLVDFLLDKISKQAIY